jgi:tRNA(Ile)-lysidine synthase TilS/MesJ
VNFIRQYCTLLGIKFFHRKIIEIKRDDCRNNGLRELYEVATKNIRFDMYKQVAQLFDNNDYIVLLGHNKDDCFENIITNIGMKTNYNNLCGIEILSKINDIVFWRPLLNIRKNDIINYARWCNIPHLQDSTPKWSQRGKIRDNVLPSLEEINDDIVNSFFELKNRMSENESIVQTFVIKNLVKKFEYIDNMFTAIIPQDMLLNDINIWSSIFRTEQFNFKISHKCLKEFVKYIDKCLSKSDNKTKFVLKHNIHVIAHIINDNMIKISFILL